MKKTITLIRAKLGAAFMPLAIVAGAAMAAAVLILIHPNPKRTAPPDLITGVETITVMPEDVRVKIHQHGVVAAAQRVGLRPEVSGKIIYQSPKLIPGGHFQTGEVIVEIDPRDYQYAEEQRRAAVEEAIFNLKQEEGRKLIAEREWKLLGQEVKTSPIGKELALRTAHMQKAQAALAAAKSALAGAELNLERTKLTAPFNAFVQEEAADLGQLVTPQQEVARLVGTDEIWVEASLPMDQLQWIELPREDQAGSPVEILQKVGGDAQPIIRKGRVVRLAGDIKPETRTATLLISVTDPHDLRMPPKERPALPLLVGAWVDVAINGVTVPRAFLLPLKALREGGRVWLMDTEGRLQFRPVKALLTFPNDTVLIGSGLDSGNRVIVSSIGTPIPGMKLLENHTASNSGGS